MLQEPNVVQNNISLSLTLCPEYWREDHIIVLCDNCIFFLFSHLFLIHGSTNLEIKKVTFILGDTQTKLHRSDSAIRHRAALFCNPQLNWECGCKKAAYTSRNSRIADPCVVSPARVGPPVRTRDAHPTRPVEKQAALPREADPAPPRKIDKIRRAKRGKLDCRFHWYAYTPFHYAHKLYLKGKNSGTNFSF